METLREVTEQAVKAAAPAAAAVPKGQWPNVTTTQYVEVIIAPIISFLVICVILYFLPVGEQPEKKKPKKDVEAGGAKESTHLLQNQPRVYLPGEEAGDYSLDWKKTFDLVFLVFMAVVLASLVIITSVVKPELWVNGTFWLLQLPKPAIMCGVSLLCGLICRQFCTVDDKGYIRTTKDSWFKVNYTRKIQHFAAYIVPLIVHYPANCNCNGMIETGWGQFITLLCFLILIKPIRESMSCVMLQFNSMDRPEDRPNTLKWIIAGNIIPGSIMILIFRTLFAQYGQEDLVYIIIFVTGLGDGFAEPVGIWLGRHKYAVRSCGSSVKYTRSYEGSACVFLSAMIFTSCLYASFHSATQFWVCFWVMAPVMAVAEATSPHTMDTPFLMGLGGAILYAVILFL